MDWARVAVSAALFPKDPVGLFRFAICNPRDCPHPCDIREPENDYRYCYLFDEFHAILKRGWRTVEGQVGSNDTANP